MLLVCRIFLVNLNISIGIAHLQKKKLWLNFRFFSLVLKFKKFSLKKLLTKMLRWVKVLIKLINQTYGCFYNWYKYIERVNAYTFAVGLLTWTIKFVTVDWNCNFHFSCTLILSSSEAVKFLRPVSQPHANSQSLEKSGFPLFGVFNVTFYIKTSTPFPICMMCWFLESSLC